MNWTIEPVSAEENSGETAKKPKYKIQPFEASKPAGFSLTPLVPPKEANAGLGERLAFEAKDAAAVALSNFASPVIPGKTSELIYEAIKPEGENLSVAKTFSDTLKNVPAGVAQTAAMTSGGFANIAPMIMAPGSERLRDAGQDFGREIAETIQSVMPVQEADPRANEVQKMLVEGVGPALGQYGSLTVAALLNPAVAFGIAALMTSYDFQTSAEDRGATREEAQRSALLGLAVSPLETVSPLMLVKNFGRGGGLRQALDFALEVSVEAGQEAFMALLQNLDANTIQQYATEVETLEGTGEAAAVGGTTSAIVNGLARLFGMKVNVKRDDDGNFEFEAEPLEGELLPSEAEVRQFRELLEYEREVLEGEFERVDKEAAGGETLRLGVDGDGGGSTVPSIGQSPDGGQRGDDSAAPSAAPLPPMPPRQDLLPLQLEPHVLDSKLQLKAPEESTGAEIFALPEEIYQAYEAAPDNAIFKSYPGLDAAESWYYGGLVDKIHEDVELTPQEMELALSLEAKSNAAIEAGVGVGVSPWEGNSPTFTGSDISDIRYDTKRVPNPQTKTPAFKRWFGDSKAVDESGEPLRLYHGTTTVIDRFSTAAGGVNTGAADSRKAFFFTTSPKVANGYAMGGTPRPTVISKLITKAVEDSAVPDTFKAFLRRVISGEFPAEYEKIFDFASDDDLYVEGKGFDSAVGANVMPVYLRLQNPLELDVMGKGYTAGLFNELVQRAQGGKFDGLVLKNVEDSFMQGFSETSDVYIVFNPNNIKSAIGNIGSFRLGTPNILRSKSPTNTAIANGQPSVRQETVKQVVDRFKRIMPGLPEVIIYDSQSQLSRELARKESLDATNKGFYIPATVSGDHQVYINADQHASDREVQETLTHEVVTHYGIRQLIASPTDTPQSVNKKLEPLLLPFWETFKEDIKAEIIEGRGYKINLETDAGKVEATEEWIAKYSETMRFGRKFKALWNRLVTFVMQQLRKVSRLKDTKFVKTIRRAEVEDLLQKSFDNLRKQQKQTNVREVVRARAQTMDAAFGKVVDVGGSLDARTLGRIAKDSEALQSVASLPQFQDSFAHSPAVVNEALQEQLMPMETMNYPLGRVYMAAGENVYLGSAVAQGQGSTLEIVRLQARTKALAAAIIQKEFKLAKRAGFEKLRISNLEAFGLDLKQLYGESALDNSTLLLEGLALEEVVPETGVGRAAKRAMDKTDLTPEEKAIGQYRFDKYNAFAGKLVNLVQISNTNKHIPGVNKYFTLNLQVHGYRKEILGRTERLLERLKDLKAEDTRDVFNAMLAQEAFYEETGEWIIPPPNLSRIQNWSPTLAKQATRDKFVKRFRLNDEKLGFMNEIADNLFRVLEELESLHVEQLRRVGIKPENMERELAGIQKKFDELKKRPYLPRMRFGDHTIRATYRNDGEGFKAGETYTYEAFPTKREAAARKKSLEAEGYNVVQGKQKLAKFRGIGMLGPEFLELVKDTLDLTDKQKEEFKELTERYSNVRGLAKHFERRRGVKGYSREWTRAFASYMMQAAYGMATVKYRPAITSALNEILASTTHLQDETGADLGRIIDHAQSMDAGTRNDIAAWYQRHFDYMMSPDAEISTLNSLAFINFLWAVPKSALVNLTQIPVMTFPVLGKRYGYTKTAAHLIKNIKYIAQWNENPDFDWSNTPDVRQALEAARREGLLDETLMRQISNAANGLEISKHLSKSTPQQWIQEIMLIGGVPFNAAEKVNRLLSFVTAFTLEDSDMKGEAREELAPLIAASQNIDPQFLVEKKWGRDPRYIIARSMVNQTQFLFGKLNRPEVFRGSLLNWLGSMLTPLFGIAWASFKDKAALGIIGMIALLSGTEGIPFIQYGYTTFDIAATKFLEKVKDDNSGWQLPVNSRMAVRQFQRDMLGDIIDNPDIISTGALGPYGILNIASSIEMGDPFYLAQSIRENALLKPGREKDSFTDMVANSFTVLSMMNDYHQNVFGSDKAMWELGPLAISNVGAPFKWKEEGGVFTQSGVPLIEFGDDYTPWSEVGIGKALGFAPRELTQGFEHYQEISEAARYWTSRREDLRNRAKNARTERKQEAVNAAIKKFNAQAPAVSLRLPSVKLIQLQMERENVKRDLGLDVPAYSRDRYNSPVDR